MMRASRLSCAGGVIVLFLAGCAGTDFFALKYLQTGGQGQDRVIVGSLETVSSGMQTGLRDLGFATVCTKEGENIRLTYTTKSGDHYSLVFSRVKTDKGEQTRIHIEGNSSANDQPHLQVLARVDTTSQH